MSVASYQNYRDSGVAWIGDIPDRWDVVPGRRIFKQTRTPAAPDDEQLSSTQKYGVIPQSLFMSLEGQKVVLAMSGTDAFKRVDVDDFVISLRSFQGGIERCRYSGCVSPAYTALKPDREVAAGYWEYLLKSMPYIAALQSITDGIREGKTIRYEQFGWLPLPVPPVREQWIIAAFLDRETRKIDALVEAQRRLIELLKEKRQAVISHAVTKGLDDTVPMKDLGVEWLGEVPAHWGVSRLKFVARVQTGVAKGKDFEKREVVAVPYLRVANVQAGYIDLTDVSMIDLPKSEIARYLLRPGDVLMNEGGDFDKLGRGAVWDGAIDPCVHQNHVFAVRPHSVSPEWLNLITGADYAQFFFMGRSKQSTNLASISSSNLMELPVLVPPKGEQGRIENQVAAACESIDELVGQNEAAIALLHERRAALISAAVTGKIDVRGLVSEQAEAA